MIVSRRELRVVSNEIFTDSIGETIYRAGQKEWKLEVSLPRRD